MSRDEDINKLAQDWWHQLGLRRNSREDFLASEFKFQCRICECDNNVDFYSFKINPPQIVIWNAPPISSAIGPAFDRPEPEASLCICCHKALSLSLSSLCGIQIQIQ